MMRRSLTIWAAVIAALGAGAYVKREPLILSFVGMSAAKRTLNEQVALIAPNVEIFSPSAGEGPFPTLITFHGCSGFRRAWTRQWARVANEAGFLVIAVDSNGVRGIEREEALKTVCAGKKLIGQERAGDVAAAIALAHARPDVDPEKIVLAGWSHGAWSVMDYLALAGAGRAPSSLKARPPDAAINGAILFYPYCGEGTWSRLAVWKPRPVTLAFVAGRDSVVSPEECRGAFAHLKDQGVIIDLVDYPDADHAFDDATLVGGPYEYFYDATAAADSALRVSAFLKTVARTP